MRNIFYKFVCNIPLDITDRDRRAIWGDEPTMFFRIEINVFQFELPILI